jgi:hypothetical protein
MIKRYLFNLNNIKNYGNYQEGFVKKQRQHLKNIESFIDGLLKNKDLKQISIDGYSSESYYQKRISDHGLTYLSNKLKEKSFPSLTYLSFMCTEIRKEGLKALSELLLTNTTIIRISFSCKKIFYNIIIR